MVQCIDAVRTHMCAPVPPPWGPKDQWEGGMDAHAPRWAENDPPQVLPVGKKIQIYWLWEFVILVAASLS